MPPVWPWWTVECVTSRLFVALWLPSAACDAMEAAIDPLRRDLGELRWQSRDRWHITVGFLGDRDDDRETQRFGRVPLVAPAASTIRGSGRFGPVLWMGVESTMWLESLAKSVHRALHTEDRHFRGHVTVARSRTPAGRRQLAKAAARLSSFSSPEWVPDELTLVRSVPGPAPEYHILARTPLTGAEA